MTFHIYKKRPQPNSRKHLGELESRKEALQRLKNIKKEKEEIDTLKNEAAAQNDNEFLFSFYTKPGNKKINKINTNKLNLFDSETNNSSNDILYVESEICRVERKLRNVMCNAKGKHIRFNQDFNEDENSIKDLSEKDEVVFKEGEDVEKYRKYLVDLKKTKEKLLNKF